MQAFAGEHTVRNRLVYAGTVLGFILIWWWAYVRPMDEARADDLICMDKNGEIDRVCKKE